MELKVKEKKMHVIVILIKSATGKKKSVIEEQNEKNLSMYPDLSLL